MRKSLAPSMTPRITAEVSPVHDITAAERIAQLGFFAQLVDRGRTREAETQQLFWWGLSWGLTDNRERELLGADVEDLEAIDVWQCGLRQNYVKLLTALAEDLQGVLPGAAESDCGGKRGNYFSKQARVCKA